MKNYVVEVNEILSRNVTVKATSEEEAKDKVLQMYADEEIVLDYDDFTDYNIEVVKEEK